MQPHTLRSNFVAKVADQFSNMTEDQLRYQLGWHKRFGASFSEMVQTLLDNALRLLDLKQDRIIQLVGQFDESVIKASVLRNERDNALDEVKNLEYMKEMDRKTIIAQTERLTQKNEQLLRLDDTIRRLQNEAEYAFSLTKSDNSILKNAAVADCTQIAKLNEQLEACRDRLLQADPDGLNWEEIEAARVKGKITCIKLVRERMGLGLKDCKEWVERAEKKAGWSFGDMNPAVQAAKAQTVDPLPPMPPAKAWTNDPDCPCPFCVTAREEKATPDNTVDIYAVVKEPGFVCAGDCPIPLADCNSDCPKY